jgi:choline-sulfatase
MFMIRRGSKKFIYADGDPLQYYNLIDDPHERNNLANNPTYATEVKDLVDEIAGNYDQSALRQKVLESQRRRRFLKDVMHKHELAWDHHPIRDAKREYIRNNMPIYQLEKKGRFPQV